MTGKRKTWISVLIAAVIVVVFLGAVAIGSVFFFVRSHIHSAEAEPADAQAQFTAVRARFAGQVPFIELKTEDDVVVHREAAGERREVRALHALFYNSREGRMSRLDVPGWALRLMSAGGRFRLANLDVFDDERANRVTLEDLERHGPGLVLDVQRNRRGQVLVWTE